MIENLNYMLNIDIKSDADFENLLLDINKFLKQNELEQIPWKNYGSFELLLDYVFKKNILPPYVEMKFRSTSSNDLFFLNYGWERGVSGKFIKVSNPSQIHNWAKEKPKPFIVPLKYRFPIVKTNKLILTRKKEVV